jgi:glucosamine--fructose-6-phosphate aminotransferase (isomerizing)
VINVCGIVGYAGDKQAAPVLLYGLERLEYRGYDSAGLSVCHNGKLNIVKASGKLSNLIRLTNAGKDIEGTSGLGHTRWATHGEPTDRNSHPHSSRTGRIAVVHNGIIENYLKLKEMLIKNGVSFASDTDTEVVAHLIDYYYVGDLLKAVHTAVGLLEGSYALGIMSSDYPGTLIAVRKESPLIVAYGEGCSFLASDVTAVLKYTRKVSYLDDGDIAVITKDRITVYDAYLRNCDKPVVQIDWSISDAQKGGYKHFMIKEIYEQPRVFKDTVSTRINDGKVDLSESGIDESYFSGVDNIVILGCGSAYHVGVVGKYLLEKYARIRVQAVLGSEFRYSEPIVDPNTLAVVISQSGETADTIAAMREAKRRGARVLAVVNVLGSTIAKEADRVIYTMAGPEIAVATTKAYSAQLAVLYLITLLLSSQRGTISENEYAEIVGEIQNIPDKMQKILDNVEAIQYFASLYFNNSSVFFIGRNLDYAICLEGSLKLKEISYIHSEAYAGGELKHGTISLVENGTLVIAMAAYTKLIDKTISNIKEVKARNANVLGITLQQFTGDIAKVADNVFPIPETHEMLLPSLAAVPLQLLSYYIALMRGCDIDKPRNLAKSVTVE